MNDRAVELLEKYDIEVYGTRKGRASLICETNAGSLILKEYSGTAEHVEIQNKLLEKLQESNRQTDAFKAEGIIRDKEGNLLVKDEDETTYILKTWQNARECDVSSRDECVQAIRLLAVMHKEMTLPADTVGLVRTYSPLQEYEKHNREIKKVLKYLKAKRQKQEFEIALLNIGSLFYEQACAVTEDWKYYCNLFEEKEDKDYNNSVVHMCHGDYQYHNILVSRDVFFIVNFEKCIADDPVRDLYLIMRKLLEKDNWSVALGKELLRVYDEERPLTAKSRIDLYYRMAYPEKFWKIVNFYYNSGKAWIPRKNLEKLMKLTTQEQEKQNFLDQIFREVNYLRM